MDDFKKKTLKKNPSNQKPISYLTDFRLDNNLNYFVCSEVSLKVVRRGGNGELLDIF